MTEKAMGRRATNKADKLQRIRTASRELFIEKGYDGATMRDLAARAGVGFGTLFDYASSKRDLLFLILNPELVRALDEGYDAALAQAEFLEQIMKLFESFYRLYEREPELSRYMLREMNFYQDGAEAIKFLTQRADFLNRLTILIQRAQAKSQLSKQAPPDRIAQILFSVWAWEVRRWISADTPTLTSGLESLRTLVRLQISGFLVDQAQGKLSA